MIIVYLGHFVMWLQLCEISYYNASVQKEILTILKTGI